MDIMIYIVLLAIGFVFVFYSGAVFTRTRADEALDELYPLVQSAKPLVEWANTVEEWTGEAKRHQVYAKLIKQFPDVPKRDLAMAIELAVRAI